MGGREGDFVNRDEILKIQKVVSNHQLPAPRLHSHLMKMHFRMVRWVISGDELCFLKWVYNPSFPAILPF